MRSFLYLTPRFAPAATVGALRAVRFCRHLPSEGWRPVVLCDFEPERGYDATVGGGLPSEVVVEVAWRAGSEAALARAVRGKRARAPEDQRGSLRRAVAASVRAVAPWMIDGPRALLHQLRVPFSAGEIRELVYAINVARSLVVRERCEAVMASGPPWEALLVGAIVAELEGLPLVLDFRDPWALCELGRQDRSWMEQQRALLLERWCVGRAAVLLLNTEAACDDYRQRYGERPGLRIEPLRNHAEPAVPEHAAALPAEPFRMVFPGRLRERVMSAGLVRALAKLAAEGWGPERLVLEVAGPLSRRAEETFVAAGVRGHLVVREWMPHEEVAVWLATADLQVVLNAPTRQRIPAKFYECLMIPRPVLVCGATPEMSLMVEGMDSVSLCGRDAEAAMVAAIRAAAERRSVAPRAVAPFTSERAAAHLADLLGEVIAARPVALRSPGK